MHVSQAIRILTDLAHEAGGDEDLVMEDDNGKLFEPLFTNRRLTTKLPEMLAPMFFEKPLLGREVVLVTRGPTAPTADEIEKMGL